MAEWEVRIVSPAVEADNPVSAVRQAQEAIKQLAEPVAELRQPHWAEDVWVRIDLGKGDW
jgi:hypothetical protein